jgi:hypothetical protein
MVARRATAATIPGSDRLSPSYSPSIDGHGNPRDRTQHCEQDQPGRIHGGVFPTMSLGNRMFCVATRGCLIASLAFASFALHAQDKPQEKPQASPATQAEPKPAPPLLPVTIGPAEREKAVEPDWDKLKCGEAKSHDEADLCEQRRMAKAAEDAVLLNKIQIVVGVVGFAFVIWNLWYVRKATLAAIVAAQISDKSALATIKAAQASVDANNLQRQTFIADQRAWLTAVLHVSGDFFCGVGGASANVSVEITNVGKTPALEAVTSIEMIVGTKVDASDIRQIVREFCDRNRMVSRWGRLVLPGEAYLRPWSPGVDGADVQAELKTRRDNSIFPIVIGCVTYQILPEKTLHQTAFAYMIGIGEGGIGASLGRIPGNVLKLHVHPGGFAD